MLTLATNRNHVTHITVMIIALFIIHSKRTIELEWVHQ